MGLEILAELVSMKISLTSVADAKSAGKVIVCETTSNADVSANTNTRKTKCGTKVTTDDPDVVIGGSGISHGDLNAATELSAMDLVALMKAKRVIYFDYKNASSGTIAAGEVVALSGEGKVSKVTITSDVSDPLVTFDWEVTVAGDWSYVP